MCANRRIETDRKSSIEIAIENSRELNEHFKDRYCKDEGDKQAMLQELAEHNLKLWNSK